MPSNFPGALDNIAANKTDTTTTAGDHAPHHNALADAINAVQTALGVNLANVEAAGAASSAVAAHVAAADPHTQYTTAAEVAAAIANFETTTQLNARDTANRNRANHTGGQAASTISDFSTAADARIAASNKVSSDPTGVTGADAITNMMSLTQAEYDVIGTKNASTLYVIAV